MAIYTSSYTKNEIDSGVGLGLASPQNIYNAICVVSGMQYPNYTIVTETSDVWSNLLLDKTGAVIAGIGQDGSLFIAEL